MTGTLYTRGSIQDLMAEKANDAAFRQALLRDPKASLEMVLGGEIPASVKVLVLEESGDTVYLVVPAATQEGGALDDSQLKKVSGGLTSSSAAAGTAGGARPSTSAR